MKTKIHAAAGAVALITVSAFWLSTATAELLGDAAAITTVKNCVLAGMVVLIPAMIIAGASGFSLGKGWKSPVVARKKWRMRIIAANGLLVLVPSALREAAYALGAPKWKVVSLITLRAARAGVVTGVLLAVARISGETAPLLFTALNNQFFTTDLAQPIATLPVTIFKFAMSPYENWQELAWAGVFIITLAVLGLNILARVVTRNRT